MSGMYVKTSIKYHIDDSNEYFANPHVIGIGDRVVLIGAIDIVLLR
jgi:hypothetical protein